MRAGMNDFQIHVVYYALREETEQQGTRARRNLPEISNRNVAKGQTFFDECANESRRKKK